MSEPLWLRHTLLPFHVSLSLLSVFVDLGFLVINGSVLSFPWSGHITSSELMSNAASFTLMSMVDNVTVMIYKKNMYLVLAGFLNG